MGKMALTSDFYSGKRVFVTGHTGFKGSWLCSVLADAGAEVCGYALNPSTNPSLYELAGIGSGIQSHIADITDFSALEEVFKSFQPEYVVHMAAQPLVLEGYRDPRGTYAANVMGTVNLLECVRNTPSVKSVLNVTTDKVYLNREWAWGYRENEELNGYDPYSNSKSCSELVTQTYVRSFFAGSGVAVSTARSGNVIGGGDFSADRIVPDCVRAALSHGVIELRHPDSIRPYQHVLEPVMAYLDILRGEHPGAYNVGPYEDCEVSTGELAGIFCRQWGDGLSWRSISAGTPHEASYLRLDSSKMRNTFGWKPVWDIETAVAKTVEWAKAYRDGKNLRDVMRSQTYDYMRNR